MEPGGDVDLFIRDQLAHIASLALRHDGPARRGEAEGFHQLRVASRRLRAVLDIARDCLDPAWRRDSGADARRLARRFGARRDADVLALTLHDQRVRDPSLDGGLAAYADLVRRRAATEATRALESGLYRRTLVSLTEAVLRPPVVRHDSLDPLVERTRRRLVRATTALDDSPRGDLDLHRLRIAVKNARYAADALGSSRGPNFTEMANRLGQAQNALGADHDLVVALAAAHEWYHSPAAAVGPDPREALAAWTDALSGARTTSADGWRIPLYEVRVMLDETH